MNYKADPSMDAFLSSLISTVTTQDGPAPNRNQLFKLPNQAPQVLASFHKGEAGAGANLSAIIRRQARLYLEAKLAREPLEIQAGVKRAILAMLTPTRISKVCLSQREWGYTTIFAFLLQRCKYQFLRRLEHKRFRSEQTRFFQAVCRGFSYTIEGTLLDVLALKPLLEKLGKHDPLAHATVICRIDLGMTLAEIADFDGRSIQQVRTCYKNAVRFMHQTHRQQMLIAACQA